MNVVQRALARILRLPVRPPDPDCMGGGPTRPQWPVARLLVLLATIGTVAALIVTGTPPMLAIAIAGSCGVIASDMAVRLLGPLPPRMAA